MLETALNLVAVGVAVGAAILVGLLVTPGIAWPPAGFLATALYITLEASELAGAAAVVRHRERGTDSTRDGGGR